MSKENMQKGLTIYNVTKNCIDWWDGEYWECTDGRYKDGHGDTFDPKINIIIPPDVELGGGNRMIISIYDNDYFPYTEPVGEAKWDRTSLESRADGRNETKLVDVQGKIPMAGMPIRIPIIVDGKISRVIPAFRQQVSVPADRTEDNISRKVELSWETVSVTDADKYIVATLKSLDGDLNVKKLDVNSGMGLDYQGLEIASFSYPSKAGGPKMTYGIRAISGIPDKHIGTITNGALEHQFIYLPVKGEDGRVWLNNNLGADYANINSDKYDPSKQAEDYEDRSAVGSGFRWGYDADGHELLRASSENGKMEFVHPKTDYSYVTELREWPVSTDPCPIGFHVPRKDEWKALKRSFGDNVEENKAWYTLGDLHASTAYGDPEVLAYKYWSASWDSRFAESPRRIPVEDWIYVLGFDNAPRENIYPVSRAANVRCIINQ